MLSPADQQQFTGQRKEVRPGDTWEIDAETSHKLLTHFYPATENNDVSKNRFMHQKLNLTAISMDGAVARARIAGNFKMEHSFYHKPDGKIAEGSVIGFVEFSPKTGRISAFDMITDKASYGGGTFAVAVRGSH